MPRRTVLVVDDDSKTLRLLRLQLEARGYPVSTALSGEKAWTRILRSPPALVLTDLRLPGMDGLELAARIRAEAALGRVAVVAVSGNSSREDQEKARAASCDAFLAKPVDARTLGKVIARLLGPSGTKGRAGKSRRKGRPSRRRRP